jgi:exopolysaccharide biosynthesis predicted pyruvyltransferase EpsI
MFFGLLLKIESLWNKNVFDNSYFSIAERFEEWIKKVRMPEYKIKSKVENFSKDLDCD